MMIGTSITDWSTVEGAMYAGAGGGEMIWLIISVVLCIASLVVGNKHELDAYKKLKK